MCVEESCVSRMELVQKRWCVLQAAELGGGGGHYPNPLGPGWFWHKPDVPDIKLQQDLVLFPSWVLVFLCSSLPHYASIHSFWNVNVYFGPFDRGSMWLVFWFYSRSQLRGCLGSRKRFLDLWTVLRLVKTIGIFRVEQNAFFIMKKKMRLYGPRVECWSI